MQIFNSSVIGILQLMFHIFMYWVVSVFQLCSFLFNIVIMGIACPYQLQNHQMIPYPTRILIVFLLNLLIKFKNADILTTLSLPVHEYRISLHLFGSILISFLRFGSFSHIDLVHILLVLRLRFTFLGANVNGIASNFKFYLFIC